MAGLNRSSSNPMRNLLPPQELLDDLCSRFVLNVPKEDLESFERILFLLEQAHWFYEDNAVEQNPSLKSLSFKEFTSLSILLNHFIFFPSVSCWSMIGFTGTFDSRSPSFREVYQSFLVLCLPIHFLFNIMNVIAPLGYEAGRGRP